MNIQNKDSFMKDKNYFEVKKLKKAAAIDALFELRGQLKQKIALKDLLSDIDSGRKL